jgi:hypothetical protein
MSLFPWRFVRLSPNGDTGRYSIFGVCYISKTTLKVNFTNTEYFVIIKGGYTLITGEGYV